VQKLSAELLQAKNQMVENKPTTGDLAITMIEANLTRDVETFGKMDPYVIFRANGKENRSATIDDAGKTPAWNQSFDVKVTDLAGDFELEVWDAGAMSDTIIGDTTFKLADLCKEQHTQGWWEIKHKGKSAGKVHVKAIWTPASQAKAGPDDATLSLLAEKDKEITNLKG